MPGSDLVPIGELARRTGVATSALRYYERLGQPPPAEPGQPAKALPAGHRRTRGAHSAVPGRRIDARRDRADGRGSEPWTAGLGFLGRVQDRGTRRSHRRGTARKGPHRTRARLPARGSPRLSQLSRRAPTATRRGPTGRARAPAWARARVGDGRRHGSGTGTAARGNRQPRRPHRRPGCDVTRARRRLSARAVGSSSLSSRQPAVTSRREAGECHMRTALRESAGQEQRRREDEDRRAQAIHDEVDPSSSRDDTAARTSSITADTAAAVCVAVHQR